jgi:hypothetical protein
LERYGIATRRGQRERARLRWFGRQALAWMALPRGTIWLKPAPAEPNVLDCLIVVALRSVPHYGFYVRSAAINVVGGGDVIQLIPNLPVYQLPRVARRVAAEEIAYVVYGRDECSGLSNAETNQIRSGVEHESG